eukprot:5580171-Alexandrium_andersonii.AAC.1
MDAVDPHRVLVPTDQEGIGVLASALQDRLRMDLWRRPLAVWPAVGLCQRCRLGSSSSLGSRSRRCHWRRPRPRAHAPSGAGIGIGRVRLFPGRWRR